MFKVYLKYMSVLDTSQILQKGDFSLCKENTSWQGKFLQDWSCGPQQLFQITGPPLGNSVNSTFADELFLRPLEWRFLPPLLNNSRDPKQPEVCDHDFIGIMKNVLWLQVFVNNAFSVQIAHSLYHKTNSGSSWSVVIQAPMNSERLASV